MTSVPTPRQVPPRVVTLSAVTRLSFAVVAGIAVASVLEPWVGDAHTRLLAAWDAAASVYLTLSWAVMRSLDACATRARVHSHDQRGYVVFLIVVAGACARRRSGHQKSAGDARPAWERSSAMVAM